MTCHVAQLENTGNFPQFNSSSADLHELGRQGHGNIHVHQIIRGRKMLHSWKETACEYESETLISNTQAEKAVQLCQCFLWQAGMWLFRNLQGGRQQPKAYEEIRLLEWNKRRDIPL